MSRSKRRLPIFGHTAAGSEKQDKRTAHQALRTHIRTAGIDEDAPLPDLKEVSNAATFAKDGKSWWKRATAKDMRK